jgi:hypothetical protein
MALSLMLVVAAGLFVRTFERLANASLGFDRDRVLVVTVTAGTIPAADRNRFYHRLVSAVMAVPGVEEAGGSLQPPLIGPLITDVVVTVPGAAPSPDAERVSVLIGVGVAFGVGASLWASAFVMPLLLVSNRATRSPLSGRL